MWKNELNYFGTSMVIFFNVNTDQNNNNNNIGSYKLKPKSSS